MINKKFSLIIKITILLALAITLFFRGAIFLDPDFGWHYRMGEIISKSGIPTGDPLSYTMPSYPFVDHESLTNLILYKLHPLIGFWGLSLLFSFIALASIYLPVYKSKTKPANRTFNTGLKFFVFTFGVLIVLTFFGVRPQVQSWLWFSVLNLVLFNKHLWKKYKFLIPVLMLLWVNLHGSFAIGIITTLLVLFSWALQRKLKLSDLIVFFLMVLATLIGPYGSRVWWEVWMQMTDSNLHFRILEWRPALLSFNPAHLFFLSLSLVFVYWGRKLFSLEEKLVYCFLLVLSMSTVRQIPFWLIMGMPLLIRSANSFYEFVKSKKFGLSRLNKILNPFYVISFVVVIMQLFLVWLTTLSYRENNYYPGGAVRFLDSNPPQGEIFAPYEWGGYLSWKYPGKRVFIDGRMPSWRWKENPERESQDAMEDFLHVAGGTGDYKGYFRKYGVETVLLSANDTKNPLSSLEEKVLNKFSFLNTAFGMRNAKFKLSDKLREDGWQVVYEDEIAEVYQK